MLVALELAHRDELVGEVGGRPALLRAQREGILLLAGDPVPVGHVLAGLAHRLEREARRQRRVREAPAERRVVHRPVAARKGRIRLRRDERRAAHRLDAARHEEVAVAGDDRMAGADDGREPGRAEPVDGDARDRLGQPGEERRHPGDVAVVLAGLVGAAEVDVLELGRIDARALDSRADRDRSEVVGTNAGEAAAVAPHRRPNRGQNDGSAHAARRGRRTSSPPQFGQSCASAPAQPSQNVHS